MIVVSLSKILSKEIELIQSEHGIKINKIKSISKPKPNENFILRSGKDSILTTFDPLKKKSFK